MQEKMEYVQEFQVRGGPETLSTVRYLEMLLQILVSAPSALIDSLTEDRLPLFFDARGRRLLAEVPKFCILPCRP